MVPITSFGDRKEITKGKTQESLRIEGWNCLTDPIHKPSWKADDLKQDCHINVIGGKVQEQPIPISPEMVKGESILDTFSN